MDANLLITALGGLGVGAGAVLAAVAQLRKPKLTPGEAAEAVNETAEIAAKLAASQEALTKALLDRVREQDERIDALVDELRQSREPPRRPRAPRTRKADT